MYSFEISGDTPVEVVELYLLGLDRDRIGEVYRIYAPDYKACGIIAIWSRTQKIHLVNFRNAGKCREITCTERCARDSGDVCDVLGSTHIIRLYLHNKHSVVALKYGSHVMPDSAQRTTN
jgi:hypothetical protein